MLLAGSVVLAASGQSAGVLWTQVALFRTSFLILYHMVTVHALWQAPFYGWFFFISAWAPRAPFVWAFLPPIAVAYLEKIAFHTTHFATLLQNRLAGNGMEALANSGAFPTNPGIHLTPVRFILAPGLWIGFAITAGIPFRSGATAALARAGIVRGGELLRHGFSSRSPRIFRDTETYNRER